MATIGGAALPAGMRRPLPGHLEGVVPRALGTAQGVFPPTPAPSHGDGRAGSWDPPLLLGASGGLEQLQLLELLEATTAAEAAAAQRHCRLEWVRLLLRSLQRQLGGELLSGLGRATRQNSRLVRRPDNNLVVDLLVAIAPGRGGDGGATGGGTAAPAAPQGLPQRGHHRGSRQAPSPLPPPPPPPLPLPPPRRARR